MQKQLLKIGDIIRIEKGMTVYINVPSKFIIQNCPFSEEPFSEAIRIGVTLVRKEQSLSLIEEEIKNVLTKKQGLKIDDEKIKTFVESLNIDTSYMEFDTSMYIGEYEVIDTKTEGGGIQRSFSGEIQYPYGYHVFCKKIDDNSINIDFYQTGCFTAMIEEIKPIDHNNN